MTIMQGFTRRCVLLALAGLVLVAGCATVYNPVTGRRERTLYSSAQEIELGRSVDARIREEYDVSGDEQVNEPVRRVGERIAAHSGRDDVPFSFTVLDSDQINAFAAPGGFIYVTTGLLDRVENEDELACVLGHEVAHVAARHSIKHFEHRQALAVPAVFISAATGGRADWAVDLAATLGMLSYSRRDELEADELGMLYARRAGYDPAAMVSFLGKLGEVEQKTPRLVIAPLSTHPPTPVRIENARRWLSEPEP